MRKHAMPYTYGIFMIILGVGYLPLALFVIRVSNDLELWRHVLLSINMSPFVILWTYCSLGIMGFFIATGVYVIVTRDRNLED